MHYVAQNLGNCGLKIVEQNHWLVEGDVFGQCFVIFWIFFAVDFAVNPTFMPRISVWAGWNDQCEWGRPLEIWRRARERRRKGVLGLSEIGEVTVSGGIQVRAVEEFVQERLCIFSSQSLVFFPSIVDLHLRRLRKGWGRYFAHLSSESHRKREASCIRTKAHGRVIWFGWEN